MDLKNYQRQTLETLSKFLTEAKIIGSRAAFENNQNAPSYPRRYFELKGLEDAPYICLRLPTGGGKFFGAGISVGVVARPDRYNSATNTETFARHE